MANEQEDRKIFECENGNGYEVPAKCCLFCKKCDAIIWDYTNGPYLMFCKLREELILDGTCPDFEEEEE